MKVLTTAIRLATKDGGSGKATIANRLAKDFMVTRLVTLKPDRDVFEAIGYLLKHRISARPESVFMNAETLAVGNCS